MTIADAVPRTGSTQASAQAKPSKSRRALGIAGYGLAAALVAIYLGNALWKVSGSNEWKLELEKDGVKVYSLKSPGAYNKQFKAVMRARYSLNQLVGGLIENSTLDNCRTHVPGCMDLKVISAWSSRTMSDTVLWKLALPAPFSPREIVIRSQVAQDPRTQVVTVDVIAAPNSTPRNEGSVRVTHLQNRWRYIPVGKGQVDIEFLQDMDMGGMFPGVLLNLAGAGETYKFIHDSLPGLLDNERVRSARYDFIAEAGQ
jgi:hypothetical protein